MAAEPPCPDPSALKRLLDAAVPAEEQAHLVRHLEICPVCQQQLQEFAADSDSWKAAADFLGRESERGEALQQVMEELRDKPRSMKTQNDSDEREEISLTFLDPPAEPDHLGKFNRYAILEVVGQGGMGVVVKALDPSLHRIVALKVMAPQLAAIPSARQRFLREARAAAAVCHEHVVTIHAVDEAKGLPYIVMQFIAGASLEERLEKRGSLPLEEILRIGMQTARGLAAAHAQGLVHRDIKPANILLENGVERVKITDFGLARAANDARITQSGVIVGTPQYMAPEQARGEAVDHRADLFSLGSVLYFLCTAQAPFQGDSSLAVLRRVCDEPPPPITAINPNVPDWLTDIIAHLQAKEPADRFSSASEVADVLNYRLMEWQRSTTPNAAAIPVAVPIWESDALPKSLGRKRPLGIGCIGLLILALGATGLLIAFAVAAYLKLANSRVPEDKAELAPKEAQKNLAPNLNSEEKPSIPPPRMTASKVEVRLSEPFELVRTGGGGRYLVFHLKSGRKLAIFDAAALRVVKEIELPTDDVVYTCSREHLLLVLPAQKLIQRWSLRTFEREKTAVVPDDRPVLRAVMGSDSLGPLLLWCGGKVICFDVARMEPRFMEGDLLEADSRWGLELRASADGCTIIGWTPGIHPMSYSVMRFSGNRATIVRAPDSQSFNGHWALPSTDGSLIFRLSNRVGIYNADMKALAADTFKGGVLLPADDPRFFLALRPRSKEKDQLTICAAADLRPLCTLPEVEKMTAARLYTQWGVMRGEPRARFLPSANILLTLPESNDRVVIRRFDFIDAVERENPNYLFVLSAPPGHARAGSDFTALLDVRSKVGGVRCRLEAGPEGMTVSDDGRLRWHVPADEAVRAVNVLVTIRDASDKEIQFRFDLVVDRP